MSQLNWYWILLMAAVPLPTAMLIAFLGWRAGATIFGNIVGAVVIFGASVGLIAREYVELDRLAQACTEPCFPVPSAFTRYAIYAFLGLFQVFALFLISIRVEHRIRNRDVAPEWR